ncbi:unnamed protein product [Schistocephalus solidus]|uniref:Integrase catalytic domain-containing protein n=1 Tax=Schistocephalus solidus TaxID=70667 RepID=A0A183T9F4_SCHSO|nr:unnamed protein product [Schistocephalus solidus]
MAEAVPLPDASAVTVAKAIFNCWVCRWGAPDQIHSDRGSSFENAVLLELYKLLKIKKTRMMAYHPQGNGQDERTNWTLINLLQAFIGRNATPTWDDTIPACMLAYRSTVNATTRHTPFFLTCGREIQLPEDVNLPTTHRMEFEDTYASRLRRTLRVAFEEARLHLQEGQRQQKAYYDRLAHGTTYQAGDILWMRNFAVPAGLPSKFNPVWVGPYVVTRVQSATTCLIRRQDRPYAEEFSVHFNRLKPGYHEGENADHSKKHASFSHQDDAQIVEHYLEVSPEGGYALFDVFNNDQQVKKLVEVPPEGGSAAELVDATEDSRALL